MSSSPSSPSSPLSPIASLASPSVASPALHTHGRWGERLILSPWRWVLFPLWVLYRPLIGLRNYAYSHQWLHVRRLPLPVISVGNIIAGGSGKTPMVEKIQTLLSAAQLSTAQQATAQQPTTQQQVHVISRGYKSDGDRNEEAELLSCPVHCNANRFQAGREALAAGATLLLMDDGFQHRQLHRDCDIVLIDATRPWGFRSRSKRPAILPLGFLREPRTSLNRAHLIILTRCNQSSDVLTKSLQKNIQRRTQCPVVRCEHAPSHYTLLGTATEIPLHDFAQLSAQPTSATPRIVLISGIAHPHSFDESMRALTPHIYAHHTFADHYHYTADDINDLQQRYAGHDVCFFCTSKDAVKLAPLWADKADKADRYAPCYVLHIGIRFLDDDEQTLLKILKSVSVPTPLPT